MSLLDTFLSDITASLRNKNGQRITELIYLDVESLPPDQQAPYVQLNSELNSQFPKNNDARLSEKCRSSVPDTEFSTFTAPFSECLVRYFRYLRDFTTSDNLTRALDIRNLASQCVTALGDSRYGIVMIPIVLSFSRTLAVIAANLDRDPALLHRASIIPSSEGSTVSFVDATANVLRDAFIKCLAGSPSTPRLSKPSPSDKRIGIYLTANSTLALLARSNKLRNATQIFTSIETQSPPLSFYPAAQRVTYLYYLGRYHFANNHFLRASIVLDSAYRQCHSQVSKHRRLILIYLIAANLTLGRLPTIQLLTRSECASFAHIFNQLKSIIKSGDIGAFHFFLDLSPSSESNPHTQFLLRHRILLQLRNRCEVFVWRSLIRQVFRCVGYTPPPDDPNAAKKMPHVYLTHIRHAALFSFSRLPSHYHNTITSFVHSDFLDAQAAISDSGFNLTDGTYNQETIGQEIDDEPFPPLSQQGDENQYPTIYAVENTFYSLIHQGFLGGFISHGQSSSPETPSRTRWAIAGAKQRGGALPAGFPVVYSSIIDRAGGMGEVDQIPGWVKEEQVLAAQGGGPGVMMAGGAGGSMAGRVVKLTGARPVGSAMS